MVLKYIIMPLVVIDIHLFTIIKKLFVEINE